MALYDLSEDYSDSCHLTYWFKNCMYVAVNFIFSLVGFSKLGNFISSLVGFSKLGNFIFLLVGFS